MNSCVYFIFLVPFLGDVFNEERDASVSQVGFDLVNIQPPASYLDPTISKRVTWVHGNLYVIQRVTTCSVFTDLGVPTPLQQFDQETSIR